MYDKDKWEKMVRAKPELAGLAYELYLRHKTKDANVATYFMWAGKLERQTERRYRNGMKKYCDNEKKKMELKND